MQALLLDLLESLPQGQMLRRLLVFLIEIKCLLDGLVQVPLDMVLGLLLRVKVLIDIVNSIKSVPHQFFVSKHVYLAQQSVHNLLLAFIELLVAFVFSLAAIFCDIFIKPLFNSSNEGLLPSVVHYIPKFVKKLGFEPLLGHVDLIDFLFGTVPDGDLFRLGVVLGIKVISYILFFQLIILLVNYHIFRPL